MLKSVFDDMPYFVRMFTVCKPKAIDGMDVRYMGRVGSTDTGQSDFALGNGTSQKVPQTSAVVNEVVGAIGCRLDIDTIQPRIEQTMKEVNEMTHKNREAIDTLIKEVSRFKVG